MPFILLLIAAVFIVCGYQGTLGNLGSLLKQDFTGQDNFGTWLFAFFLVGALGYIPGFKRLSDAFLLLIIIVIIIVNDKNGQGFFQGVQNALGGSTVSSTTIPTLNSGGLLSNTPTLSVSGAGENNLTIGSL